MLTVAAAIIVRDGKLLAARKRPGLPLAGSWEFPGGKVEEGESPEECLNRELFEELGIDCLVLDFVAESVYHDRNRSIRLLGYLVKTSASSFALTDHDAIRWLGPDQVADLAWAPADIPLAEVAVARFLRT